MSIEKTIRCSQCIFRKRCVQSILFKGNGKNDGVLKIQGCGHGIDIEDAADFFQRKYRQEIEDNQSAIKK